MPALSILRLGHPALRTPAQPLPLARLADPAVQQLIDDLIATMREASGIGLAAPQVGAGFIFVYERPVATRDKGPVAVVNPDLVFLPGEPALGWEGACRSPACSAGCVAIPRRGSAASTGPADRSNSWSPA